jgi:two-component system, sensor histidine kinase
MEVQAWVSRGRIGNNGRLEDNLLRHVVYCIGLNISRELVRLLNGNLTVESEKHVGSTFSFSAEYNLPSQTDIEEWYKDHPGFAVTPGRNVTPTREFAEDAGPVDDVPTFTHIMAAEDNALNRKILGRYLHDRPTVALTTDGQEAFEYFASDTGSRVQLIVMDCEMPRLDGRKATQKIRALEAERRAKGEHVERVPIIGLSGNARPEQIAEAKDVSSIDRTLINRCILTHVTF